MSVAPVLRRSGGGDAGSIKVHPWAAATFCFGRQPPKKNVCCCAACVLYESNFHRVGESFFFPAAFEGCQRSLGATVLRARGFDVRPPAGPERAAAAAAPDRASSGVSRERARTGEIFCPWGASLPLRVLPPRRETIAAGARVRVGRRGAGSRARACSPMWGALPSARKAARLDCAPRSSAQRLPAARRASEGRSRATVGASYARARRRAAADGSRGARRPALAHGFFGRRRVRAGPRDFNLPRSARELVVSAKRRR